MPISRIALVPLETRETPAAVALGDGWADARNLTLSFAPDGTLIGQPPAGAVDVQTTTAVLTGTLGLGGLNALLSPLTGGLNGLTGSLTSGPNSRSNTNLAFGRLPGWQSEVLRAFQTWVTATNLNIGLTADTGMAFGSSGSFQGDARFGDIRIGGTQLDPSALANAVVVSPEHGTWSGDVLFNTSTAFSTSGFGWPGYDLYTVALHEAGHVFGLKHSDDPSSVMSEGYLGVRLGLSATDLATVRSYYGGARRADGFDLAGSNDTQATATALATGGNFSLTADLTTSNDIDWYSFNVSVGGPLTAKLSTSGLSLLTARLSVVDASGKVVGTAVASDPTRGDLTITVPNATAGKYFLRVSSDSDDFGVGRYQLAVSGLGGATITVAPPTFGTAGSATASAQTELASGTLTKSNNRSDTVYTMSSSGLFTLSADATSNVSGASLVVEVFDANGKKVLSFTQSPNGSSESGSAYLQAGKYTIRATAVIPLLSWGGKVDFTLRGEIDTDPMGTYPTKVSASPSTPTNSSAQPASPPTSPPTPASSTPPKSPPTSTTTPPYSY